MDNTTKANCNNTPSLATSVGATNFNGVEDVVVLPNDNSWIYFTAKGPGRVYRFQDNAATVSNFSIYVESQNYDVDGAGPIAPVSWGTGNDNLAFDAENNLWVLQDGGNGHIWMVHNGHSLPGNPKVELFGRTLAGSESSGITFTPDYNHMFISFQCPNGGNSTGTVDATGTNVVFNTPTTVVFARKEFLGAATFLVTFNEVLVYPLGSKVRVEWNTGTELNLTHFEIERILMG